MRHHGYKEVNSRTLDSGEREVLAVAVVEMPKDQGYPMVNIKGDVVDGIYTPKRVPGFRIWRKTVHQFVRAAYSEGDPRAMHRDDGGRLIILRSDPLARPEMRLKSEEYGPSNDCGYTSEQAVLDLLLKKEQVMEEEPAMA